MTISAGFYFCEVSKLIKLLETESRTVVARCWDKGEEENCSMDAEF